MFYSWRKHLLSYVGRGGLIMKLFEIFPGDASPEIGNALNSFYDKAYEYVHGSVEDQHKAYYMLIFHKNFKIGFFNQCIEVIEKADTDVKPLIPSILWNYAEKNRQSTLVKFP